MGNQTPFNESSFSGSTQHGIACVKLANRLKQAPFPWQEDFIVKSLMTDQEGKWTHPNNVLIVPRQNGKSWILVMLVIYKLFVLNEKIIFTAHQFQTSQEIFRKFVGIVESVPSLKNRVVKKLDSQGKGLIRLAPDNTGKQAEALFITRSANSARGLSAIDTLFYDESYDLTHDELSALAPTQMASPNPQTIYVSSAVNADEHKNGVVLSEIRDKGLNKEEGLFLQEFMADPSLDYEDPNTWRAANPSYGVIQDDDKIRAAGYMGKERFGVEFLGWGKWFSKNKEVIEPVYPIDKWNSFISKRLKSTGDSALAVDVSPDGKNVSIVICYRVNNKIYASLSPRVEFSRVEVLKELSLLIDFFDPVAVVIDMKTPASTLVSDLEKNGIEPVFMSARTVSSATNEFFEQLNSSSILHDGSDRFVSALQCAEFRTVSGNTRGGFTTKQGDITPLVAVVNAIWGLVDNEIPEDVDVDKDKRFVGSAVVASNDFYTTYFNNNDFNKKKISF